MSRRLALQLGVATLAVLYGLAAEVVARHRGQLTTYAGALEWAAGIELLAGIGLVVSGFLIWYLRSAVPIGPLLLAAAFAWFTPDWVGWEGGPSIVRSLAMLLAGLWLALIVHAVLVSPHGHLPSLPARLLVTALYVETAVVAVGRALFRNPFDIVDCWDNCTTNSLLVHSDPSLAHALGQVDRYFAVAVAAAFLAVSAWNLGAASRPARRLLAPALAAGAAVTSIHATHAIALLHTPLEAPRDPVFAAAFLAQCLAVVGVALVLGLEPVRARRARRAVEQLVVELTQAPEPGTLETTLVRATSDASLRVVYPLRGRDRYIDGTGRSVTTPVSSATRALTPIVHEGRQVALLEHDRATLDDRFQDGIGAAVRLAVENERLQAEVLAQLNDLRESRARIVAASDTARRRLERDLHDGAQQRLVALSFGLRVALAELEPDPCVSDPLGDAERALGEALSAVRAVANGLFPAALTSAGLAHAVEELAALAPLRIEVEAVTHRRFAGPVEAAAYGVIREAVENAAIHAKASVVSVSAVCSDGEVIVDAVDDGVGGADPQYGYGLLDIADRVAALGGRFRIQSPLGAGTHLHAEIPCS